VAKIDRMTADDDKPSRWKGDEVEDRPGTEAEDAADRVEGNQRVRADAESRRLQNPDPADQPEDQPGRPTRDAAAEEKIAEVAEEHRARKDAGERPPRGKL
jgi:hypothetical protein